MYGSSQKPPAIRWALGSTMRRARNRQCRTETGAMDDLQYSAYLLYALSGNNNDGHVESWNGTMYG